MSGKKKGIFSPEISTKAIVVAALNSGIYYVLGTFGTLFQPIPGVSVIYPASGYASATGIWFGFWGVLGPIIGTILSAPFWGYSIPVAIAFGVLAGMWDALIPAIVWRVMKLDPMLRDKRSIIMYIIFGSIVNTFIDAFGGMIVSIAIGWYTPEFAFTVAIWPWFIADAVACLTLGVLMLKLLTPYIERSGLYFEGFFALTLIEEEGEE
ncbi:MAG: hypothetical protein J7L07_02055 [Candidatus Odinarchaeota archaeon]|nr:hypothetical protein [Candidatus Odinarchaeota archaeon]